MKEPEVDARWETGSDAATHVGAVIAERLKGQGVDSVVFDRGGHVFHGRVKAIADAARKAGLKL